MFRPLWATAWIRRSAVAGLLIALSTIGTIGGLVAQQGASDYMQPRYPRYLVNPSKDRMLDAARLAVRQPYGMSPLGKMQGGQRVHVFIEYSQDMDVWEAIRQAWKERGVEAIAVPGWETMGIPRADYEARSKANLLFGGDGWKEQGVFEPAYVPFFPPDVQKQFGQPLTHLHRLQYVKPYMDKHPEIQFVFHGPGGGKGFFARSAGEMHADKWVGNWTYENKLDLLSKVNQFPGDVWSLIDDRIIKAIPFTSEGTFTDPEGTRLHWVLSPGAAQAWGKAMGGSNHLNIYPDATLATWKEGVLRATGNHTGFFPVMTVHLSEHGRVARIEGGGKNGDLFRMLLEHPKFKNAKFPDAPEPGYWYLNTDGFATNPKFVRNLESLTKGTLEYANLSERQRAGVQHFSFSYPGSQFASEPKNAEYAKTQGIPLAHTSHMHVYFGTIRWKLADTGEWITISDKGMVASHSDPEVRALAAKYGDPNLLFRYEWVPEIPGINAPGDHDRGYGADPWKWILNEWARIQSGKYDHYVDDYTLSAAPAAQ